MSVRARRFSLTSRGHGRHAIGSGVDLSGTVGWFTSLYPVALSPGPVDVNDAWSGGPALGRVVGHVKELLRSVPAGGVGYGILRYLNPKTAGTFAGMPVPQISFNYLGRLFAADRDSMGTGMEWRFRSHVDSAIPLAHAVEVNALVVSSPAGVRIRAHWSWARAIVPRTAVRELAQGWRDALGRLVEYSNEHGYGGRTPSDLPLVSLTQEEVALLEKAHD